MEREKIIEKALEIYGKEYDYSLVEDAKSMDNINIICKKHGIFHKRLSRFLNGSGCPICSGKVKKKFSEFVEESNLVHNYFYVYNDSNYINSHTKIGITCPIHGTFYQTPTNHLNGNGCPKCKAEKQRKVTSLTKEGFVNKSSIVHDNKYSYSNAEYVNNHNVVTITCPIHGDFQQLPHNHLQGKGCPVCGNNLSKSEDEINKFINELGIETIRKDKKLLNGLEIDIFVPTYNIGIEYNGLYWHSNQFKDKNYHLEKTEICEKKNIRLIHIFEDEWKEKKEIVKSMLCNVFMKTPNKIYARNCTIKNVKQREKEEMLKASHIQGNVISPINIGLYYDDKLVSIMCFGKTRINLGSKKNNDGEYELLRFCNKPYFNVVGGASRLFKYFIRKYDPKLITSYCDYRWSVGNLYKTLGFSLHRKSLPNYYYIIDKHRENRFKYRKSELVKKGFDKNKTEKMIMEECGINRIYDCGTLVFKWKKPTNNK